MYTINKKNIKFDPFAILLTLSAAWCQIFMTDLLERLALKEHQAGATRRTGWHIAVNDIID